MLTAQEIDNAKKSTVYSGDAHHEHDDCIRIAFEWLDAQTKIGSPTSKTRPLKHIIEKWGGRYVSQSDVEVAAHIHPEIFGRYPHYNIGAKLVQPLFSRLDGVSEVNTQSQRERFDPDTYQLKE
ncbi:MULTISPECIES: hypothetical protein [Ensifer]|uniref:hypothetical protein n=1 Tax=Ensifer TaxID=106591 RepID=UPI000715489E|nr:MULTISPECIES: hypothetical protein [Ensifer]KQX21783.1 hypothetical protein ASD01_29140 [Ensifer sp. Root423]QHG70107.1 hypothetical protein DQW09_09685 [Ensifer adhaerens]